MAKDDTPGHKLPGGRADGLPVSVENGNRVASKSDTTTGKAICQFPPEGTSYNVGYAKPPAGTRFKPGQSGNPRGRPRGSRNRPAATNDNSLMSIIMKEAYRQIQVRDGGRVVTIPMAKAVVRNIAVSAAKGHQRSQHHFTQLLSMTEKENRALQTDKIEVAIEYKKRWKLELRRRKELGIVAPAPLPHPDDVIIDRDTGSVRIRGSLGRKMATRRSQPSLNNDDDMSIQDLEWLRRNMPDEAPSSQGQPGAPEKQVLNVRDMPDDVKEALDYFLHLWERCEE